MMLLYAHDIFLLALNEEVLEDTLQLCKIVTWKHIEAEQIFCTRVKRQHNKYILNSITFFSYAGRKISEGERVSEN